MTKFIFFFVVALCLAHNFQTTLAESEEEEASIQNIIQIVEQLAVEIKEVVQDLSDRLPKIVKNLEKSVKGVIEDVSLTEIFEAVKEEIEELLSNNIDDDSSTRVECSKMAYEELEDLNEKTRTDISNCVTRAQKKTSEIKDEVEVLMTKANSLAQEMAKKIETCAQVFGEDAIGLSNCLQAEIKAIKKLLKQLKNAINETIDVTEKVSGEVAEDVAECLKEVRIDTLKNTEHVTDELKACIGEA